MCGFSLAAGRSSVAAYYFSSSRHPSTPHESLERLQWVLVKRFNGGTRNQWQILAWEPGRRGRIKTYEMSFERDPSHSYHISGLTVDFHRRFITRCRIKSKCQTARATSHMKSRRKATFLCVHIPMNWKRTWLLLGQ